MKTTTLTPSKRKTNNLDIADTYEDSWPVETSGRLPPSNTHGKRLDLDSSPTVSDKLQQFLQTSASISENLQSFQRILRDICKTGFAECLRISFFALQIYTFSLTICYFPQIFSSFSKIICQHPANVGLGCYIYYTRIERVWKTLVIYSIKQEGGKRLRFRLPPSRFIPSHWTCEPSWIIIRCSGWKPVSE